MSRKEVPRAGLLKAALAGKISNAQGAHAVHVSGRQFQRLKVRYVAEGPRGLLHRPRGRVAPRRLPADVLSAPCTRSVHMIGRVPAKCAPGLTSLPSPT